MWVVETRLLFTRIPLVSDGQGGTRRPTHTEVEGLLRLTHSTRTSWSVETVKDAADPLASEVSPLPDGPRVSFQGPSPSCVLPKETGAVPDPTNLPGNTKYRGVADGVLFGSTYFLATASSDVLSAPGQLTSPAGSGAAAEVAVEAARD